MRQSRSRTSRPAFGSRLAIGSSATTILGACISIRAIATRLLLASGELGGAMGRAVGHPDALEALHRAIALRRAGGRAEAAQQAQAVAPHGAQQDVLECAQLRHQIELLENVAHASPDRPQAAAGGVRHRFAVNPDRAGSKLLQPVEAAHQGGLAAAIGAEEDHALTIGDLEGDPAQTPRACRSRPAPPRLRSPASFGRLLSTEAMGATEAGRPIRPDGAAPRLKPGVDQSPSGMPATS